MLQVTTTTCPTCGHVISHHWVRRHMLASTPPTCPGCAAPLGLTFRAILFILVNALAGAGLAQLAHVVFGVGGSLEMLAVFGGTALVMYLVFPWIPLPDGSLIDRDAVRRFQASQSDVAGDRHTH
jgi:hypothetical protein